MAAARNRAIHGFGADRLDLRAKAQHLVLVRGTHFRPDLALAEARERAILGFHDRGARRRARQAGDQYVDLLGHFARAIRPFGAAVDKRARDFRVQIAHGQVDAVAQQAAGKLAADIAQPDETHFQHYNIPGIRY